MAQTALITGGAQRIGKTLALALAEHGYDIALHYHTSQDDAEATADTIRATGQKCTLFSCNFNEHDQYHSLIPSVIKQCDILSLLVNNASIFQPSALMETNEANFDQHMEVNFKAPYFLTQSFAKHCKQGHVINLLDTFITKHSHTYFTYLLTKKLLADFTRMAAKELAPDIRVNGIAPGHTLPAPDANPDYPTQKAASIPMQACATPEDIARSLLQLVENPVLTGQILYVDGGENLC